MKEGPKSDFARRVVTVVRNIPRGKKMSYAEVARRAGSPRAFRAVGNIMNRWGMSKTGIPCHRVVRSDGTIGGYADGPRKKEKLLRREGALTL